MNTAHNVFSMMRKKIKGVNEAEEDERKPDIYCHPKSTLHSWLIMWLISFLLFGSYFAYDALTALSPFIVSKFGLSDAEYASLHSLAQIPMIFGADLFLGIGVDQLGPEISSLLSSFLLCFATVINSWASTKSQMLAGRILFTLANDALCLAQNTMLCMWFTEGQLAFAMGFSVTVARLGSIAAFFALPRLAINYGFEIAIWFSVVVCILSLIGNVVEVWLENRAKKWVALVPLQSSSNFSWKIISSFSKSYWYLCFLCVFFHTSIDSFSNFSVLFLIDKYGYDDESASWVMSVMSFAAVIVSPFAGWIIDKYGLRGSIMSWGCFAAVPCMLALGYTEFNPVILITALGVIYTVVPAAIWPAVPLTMSVHLGTGYGILYSLLSVGYLVVPMIAGKIQDTTNSYELPHLMYAAISLIAWIFAVLLQIEDGRHDNVLQKPTLRTQTCRDDSHAA